jgi:16S rRNA (guanine527-N7)-methyltransferase
MAAKLGSLASRTARASTAAKALGTALDATAQAHVGAWLARLEEWNARIDLTAARSEDELVDLMLADALVLAPRIPPAAHLVDVGTGAGAPGLALALLRPDLHVTLVEPLGKRASFLRTVIGEVGRVDITLERAHGEALAKTSAWSVAVSRATIRPSEWLALGTRLASPGGIVWVLLADDEAPRHPRAQMEIDLAYVWPLTGAPRRALGYRVLD